MKKLFRRSASQKDKKTAMSTKYVSMKADRNHISRHKKVFTRWINLQLAKAKPPVVVSDVISELRDGQMLLTLVELLLGIHVTRSEPTNKRINMIRNVQEAMRHLLKHNVKTTGIIASEITAGDEKAILGLLWSIIQRFQVMEATQQDHKDYHGDIILIAWSQECIKGNSQKVRIHDLTSSWNDGVAFNVLLHSFNPSLFDLDAILSSDVRTRLTHAFNLATSTYDVPPLFDPEDVGLDTPDKNLITLFLSYLYQRMVKGSTVKIVKKEITVPSETTKEYEFKTITTRHETSRSGGTTINFQTITTTQEENHDEVFHDIKTIKEGGQGKVLIVDGFPQKVQIEQRRALVVSPFRKPSGSSSRTSSGQSSPISKDSDSKIEEEALMSTPPPQISGEGSYEYTVTQTRRIVTNSGERVTSTTTNKTLQSSMEDSYKAIKATNGDKENDSVLLRGKRGETDAKIIEHNVKDEVINDNWIVKEKEKAPSKKTKDSRRDEKDTEPAVLTTIETVTLDKDKDKEQKPSGKGQDEKDNKPAVFRAVNGRDETDAKLTERNVKDAVITDNWVVKEKEKAPWRKTKDSGRDEKDTEPAVPVTLNKDKDKDKEQKPSGKGQDEKDNKPAVLRAVNGRDETDDKLTELNVKDAVINDNWIVNEKEKAPWRKTKDSGRDEKDTEPAVFTTIETVTLYKDKDKDKLQKPSEKGQDEKDSKPAVLGAMNEKIDGKDKDKVKGQTSAKKTSSGPRDVFLKSKDRISSGSVTPVKTEPVEHSVTEENGYSSPDGSPVRYYKYSIENSTSPRYRTEIEMNLGGKSKSVGSTYFVDYFKKKLDAVDQSLFDLERNSKHSDKDSMDLKTTKNALDQQKEVVLELELVQSKVYVVLDEGRQLIKDRCFNRAHVEYFQDRMDATAGRMKILEDDINKEHQRLFDLYIILLKQHLERMNDWLVRAESRIALDDVIEPTYEGVKRQVFEHQNFVEELSNYSMVNMILDMDMEHPAIDETIRDWIKVLSERWAVVWTWAEEWKQKLKQALLDWEKFIEEESALLAWLSAKERTMDVIGQTDVTNEEQVKMHLNLLEKLDREMGTQRGRLESLNNAGEKLIIDAEYHNSTAKGIRDQTEDFEKCWGGVARSVQERKAMLKDAQNKVKRMGNLMREVRAWLDEAEAFIKFARLQEDQRKATEIQEKVEVKCEERERNQLKVDEINKLEDELSRNIDETSNFYLKRVTKPFNQRWNDASLTLNRYRNEDSPFIKPDDCFLIKCLKKALVVN